MIITNVLLSCLIIVEFLRLCVEIYSVLPDEDPPLDEEVRKKLYC